MADDVATLTLNNACITENYTGGTCDAAIYSYDTLSIVLQGENTVIGGDVDGKSSSGIFSDGNLEIDGRGSLTVVGGAANGSYGIAAKDITISGGTVTAVGGKATDASKSSTGVYGSYLTVSAGTVIAVGGEGATSYGIHCWQNVTAENAAKVIAVGGKGTNSYGVYVPSSEGGNIAYNGGLLVAKGGTKDMSQAVTGEGSTQVKYSSDKCKVYDTSTDYHVQDGNVTNATTDVTGHLEWTDTNLEHDGNESLALTNTIIIGTDGENDSCALTIPAGGMLTSTGFNVVLAGDVTGDNRLTAIGGYGKYASYGISAGYNDQISLNGSGLAVGGSGTNVQAMNNAPTLSTGVAASGPYTDKAVTWGPHPFWSMQPLRPSPPT